MQARESSPVIDQRSNNCATPATKGGPAKVRPTYIFDGNIWMQGSYSQNNIIRNSKANKYQQNYKQTILP